MYLRSHIVYHYSQEIMSTYKASKRESTIYIEALYINIFKRPRMKAYQGNAGKCMFGHQPTIVKHILNWPRPTIVK
jgi:hypothetical protein